MIQPDNIDDDRHLWVRMGGPAFCGKSGCGLLLTPQAMKEPCHGEESGGIRLLRQLRRPVREPDKPARESEDE